MKSRCGRVVLPFSLVAVFSAAGQMPAYRQHQGHQGATTPMHEAMADDEMHEMPGLFGDYSMTREASGTSWQPEAVPMQGLHFMADDWMLMLHASAFLAYDHQGGPRGDDHDVFSANMFMLMARHPLGDGAFGIRAMLSLEPATMGRNGYPELLQTGETGNGIDPLIDRQHPHDFLMELAASYHLEIDDDSSAFAYFGLPGEPALGPATFMHRFSGMDNLEAPLTHHWLDSTHITFGVATVGYVWREFKVDASIFTGREPDESRWDFDRPRFDSQSVRLTYNPTPAWSFQVSYGHINSPEQLDPTVDIDRWTASVSYHHAWADNHWQTTFAWGRNVKDPGDSSDGFLLESSVNLHRNHTVFGRLERVTKDELFPAGHPLDHEPFTVNKASLGYIYDFELGAMVLGVGGIFSIHLLPGELTPYYGETPRSFLLFVRAKL